MNISCWIAAGADSFDFTVAKLIENSLRHHRTARISSTKNENALGH